MTLSIPKLGVLAIAVLGGLSGCAAPTWQDRLITPQNAQCYEQVKHWDCATLVQTDLRVRSQFVEVQQRLAKGIRIYSEDARLNAVPDADLLKVGNSLIQQIDDDLEKLRDLPECWRAP